MLLIRDAMTIPPNFAPCVATMGNFDGVHLGHQAIMQQVLHLARQQQLPAVAIVFEPQPQEFFLTTKAPARLTNLREKYQLLKQLGLDVMVCLRFNQQFAQLPADVFVQRFLLDKLHIKQLIIGDDFRFGYQRQGDYALLHRLGANAGMQVSNTHSVMLSGERVSSSRIRQLLQAGEFVQAAELLGRPYTMTGRVIHGQKLGRTLGYPTINIPLKRLVSPLQGIYAVKVSGLSNEAIFGAASLGTRPTIHGHTMLLEVYLLDFERDVYGQTVTVEFIKKIRDEQYFPDLVSLKQQIQRDVAALRVMTVAC